MRVGFVVRRYQEPTKKQDVNFSWPTAVVIWEFCLNNFMKKNAVRKKYSSRYSCYFADVWELCCCQKCLETYKDLFMTAYRLQRKIFTRAVLYACFQKKNTKRKLLICLSIWLIIIAVTFVTLEQFKLHLKLVMFVAVSLKKKKSVWGVLKLIYCQTDMQKC